MWRKIFLLSWKNLLYFKRHYIVTALEIILPTLFAIALAYIKSKVGGVDDGLGDYYRGSKVDVGFPEYNETEFIDGLYWKFRFRYGSNQTVIPYTPESEFAKKIIEDLVRLVEEHSYNPDMPNETFLVDVRPFSSEDDMVKFVSLNEIKAYYKDRPIDDPILNIPFGLVFDGLSDDGIVDSKVSYKIRMNERWGNIDTGAIWDTFLNPGPSIWGATRYVDSGFIGIQYILDKLLIKTFTGGEPTTKFTLQAFPYPPYKDLDIQDLLFIFLPVLLVTGFVFIVPQVVRGVVSEKETGIKELMKMSGLPEWMHWVGWMLNSLVILTITSILIVIIFFVPFNSEAGAVFEHSDPTLFWVVLMIYMIWAITYCFVVAACFEKPTLATTFGIIVWLVSFYGLGLAMQESYGKDFSKGLKLLFCLFPNVAIHLALKAICDLEVSEAGSRWGNINETISGTDGVTLLYVILMFFASICLNMAICLYIEAVFPKKYGVRKPFYFIFQPSEWGFGKRASESVLADGGTNKAANKGFEEDPQGIKAGVQIKNLRKEFGKEKVAVNDVTMNIFAGQIFCLLGQNGAGKTTTMSILTGLIPPTAGTAYIDGYDIRTNMNKIRENLGLCPQHNMLFDKMTVIEHLKFFGMLKGLSSVNAEKEGKSLLGLLQIEEKKNVLSMSLSGGQKRRLSLGCALIGGSKVIFLDEPTSGMDPEARRAIWDILLKIRGERTIVLTTHFMEEADVLGDRIAILANGALQCCGTPNYLKRFYGAGYTLNMTTTNGANRDEILQTVCKHIEDAHFKASHSNNANELSIVLPSDSNTTSKFPNMFSDLRKEQKRLAIDEIGVGWTTMDEVFVRVEELSHDEDNNNEAPKIHQNGLDELGTKHKKLSGLALTINQFYGLLLKKLFYTMRKKRLVITQMLVPVLLTIAAISIGRVLFIDTSETWPALKMSMSPYRQPVTLYSSEKQELGDIYARVVGSSARVLDSSHNGNVSLGLLAAGRRDITDYREKYVVAAELSDTNDKMKGMYTSLAHHSAPLSLNLLTNAYLQSKGEGNEVEATSHPFPNDYYDMLMQSFSSDIDTVFAIIFAVLLPVGLALLLGSFIIGPTEERISKGKQLQLMTGVNPFLYWSSSFICDMLLTLISICLMTACLPIFERNKMFTNHDGAGVLFLIMAVYALASIPFSYIFSTFVPGVAGGFTLITIINISTGVGLGIASYVIETQVNTNPNAGAAMFIQIIGRLFPTFGVTKASINYAETSSHNSLCYTIPERTLDFICNPDLDVENLYFHVPRECCPNCADFDGCFQSWSYFNWTKTVEKYEYPFGYSYYDVPALTQDLVWLTLMAVVYFAILMLIEYDVFKRLVEAIFKEKDAFFKSSVDDGDVLEENERVSRLVKTGTSSEDAMVVNNLCKSFGSFSAVSKLSFGVHRGECFGLLGVNGAGKTTTFRMLTGDENRSNGNAYMDNLSLASGRKDFLGMLGYCPQFDGIIGVLSGKEMLRLFARLRGIPGNRVEEEADKWLQRAGLTSSANVQCKKYSGGMKRRLSAAMALIGDPAVILLDEPTSGVDPVARRQFWKIISSIKNSGQAIILTSHSMEECEALCSRLGIMVNGEMQCLGGVQHLKNKFAQGYSLMLKLKAEVIQENPNVVQAITNGILQYFEPSSLKDHHQTTMKFQIHSRSLPWEELYSRMERIKSDFLGAIEEYAITETTLEEVFMSFARKQYVNDRLTAGGTFSRLTGGCGGCMRTQLC